MVEAEDWPDMEMEGACQTTLAKEPMLKLNFPRKYIGRPGKRPRNLTKVWSSKESFEGWGRRL